MFVKFSEKAQKALVMAESYAFSMKQGEVTTLHLLLGLLKIPDLTLTNALKNDGVSWQSIKSKIEELPALQEVTYLEYSSSLTLILEKAMNLGVTKKVSGDLLGWLLLETPCDASLFLQTLKVDVDHVKLMLENKKEHPLEKMNELVDLNRKVLERQTTIIGREEELALLMELLCRKDKNNVIIVGDAGVGKTALVEKLACELNHLDSGHPLYKKRVYEMDLAGILAGTKYRGDFEEKMKKIIRVLKEDPLAIVFIDEIHNLVDAGKAEGAIDASNILKPYLARGEISCIGATTYQEYKKYFENDPALNRRFAKIDLKEENDEAVLRILKGLRHDYETYHHVKIPIDVLEDILASTNTYMHTSKQPDKALDALDLCCVKARMLGKNEVNKAIVLEVVSRLSGISFRDSTYFEHLKEDMLASFPKQEDALKQFLEALKEGKHSFLFYGQMGWPFLKMFISLINGSVLKIHASELRDDYRIHRLMGNHSMTSLLEKVRRYPETWLVIEGVSELPLSFHHFLSQLMISKEYEEVDFSKVMFVFLMDEPNNSSVGFMKQTQKHPLSIEEIIYFHKEKVNLKEISDTIKTRGE